MQLVITPEESARLDAAAAEPVDVLMERAGLAVALAAVEMGAGYGRRVTVLAGTGNNGGDGYVAASHLARRGVAVTVAALGEPKSDAARAAERAAIGAGVRIVDLDAPAGEPDLVIDALFGVGFRGALPEAVVPWLDGDAPVLAVDVPSGLAAADGSVPDRSFTADRTVTFHAYKPGHFLGEGPDRCGDVSVHDIGLVGGEPVMKVCEDGDAPLPERDRSAHKWSVGSVLVVGGVAGMTGAALLSAQSALSSGAGAVGVAVLDDLQSLYASADPGLLTHAVGAGDRYRPQHADALARFAERYDVLVVGPGLGGGVDGFVAEVMRAWPGPMVMDADALNALAAPSALARRDGRPTVLTPHAGEFARLTGATPSPPAGARLAAATDAVVLLKGSPTFVAGSDTWVVTSGGPELATIGTGDVLAGAIGAALARGLPPETAARSAAHRHGCAGAWLAARTTVTATKLVDAMGVWMQ